MSRTNNLDTQSLSAVRLVVELVRDCVTLGDAIAFSVGLFPLILARVFAGAEISLATGVAMRAVDVADAADAAGAKGTAAAAGAASTNAICGLTT